MAKRGRKSNAEKARIAAEKAVKTGTVIPKEETEVKQETIKGPTENLKDQFFKDGISGWNNHLPLLWIALEATGEGDVVELGCGDGSTNQLDLYCKAKGRKLYSFEMLPEWLERFKPLESDYHKLEAIQNKNWTGVHVRHANATVVLIDHNPGEDRGDRLRQFEDNQGIVVCHDSEPRPCGGNYGWDFSTWKYVIHVAVPMNGETNGTWATAVSNTIDITKFKGQVFGNYTVS